MPAPPHIVKHWNGWPPPCVQAMMHSSAMRHAGSERQVCAWAQHFCAMQSRHAPPGEPHVLGGPQVPFEH